MQKLVAIRTAIEEAKQKNEPLHLLALDFERAFPSLEHWVIEDTLEHYKVPLKLKNAVLDTLKGMSTRFRVKDQLTEPVEITNGIRQGNPLSAILFAIAVNPC